MMKFRVRARARALATVGAAVTLAASLAGCSLLSTPQPDAERDDTGQVTEEANIDIFALKVGDCMPASDPDGGDLASAEVVPCTAPHAEEVFYEFELTGVAFPDQDTMWSATEAECDPAFEEFVGAAYDDSELEYYPISPTEGSWENSHDRVVQCVVYDPADDQLTSTLQGAAR